MSLKSLKGRTSDWFVKCYGQRPRWTAAAPGRVNLIGEHTDYNLGFVLPVALDRYTAIAARGSSGNKVTIHNVTTGDTAEFEITKSLGRGDPPWTNYVRGVIKGFIDSGKKVRGFSAVIDSDVPLGGGLASSAAISVATATLVEAMCGLSLDPLEKALLCQKAEHQFAGAPCGIMDQIVSIMGRKGMALLLDCRSLALQPVDMRNMGISIVIINTGVRHKIAETQYAQRREQCMLAAKAIGVEALRDATSATLEAARNRLDPILFKRARHVILENERTLATADAIKAANWPKLGELLYASHDSLRDDYEVSCTELDRVVGIARSLGPDHGVIGCRMTGAGFGGSAVCVILRGAFEHLTRLISGEYFNQTGEQLEMFEIVPSAGAHIL